MPKYIVPCGKCSTLSIRAETDIGRGATVVFVFEHTHCCQRQRPQRRVSAQPMYTHRCQQSVCGVIGMCGSVGIGLQRERADPRSATDVLRRIRPAYKEANAKTYCSRRVVAVARCNAAPSGRHLVGDLVPPKREQGHSHTWGGIARCHNGYWNLWIEWHLVVHSVIHLS